jgi:hypothetical protein
LSTGLDPAMTLGCGGYGGNITSDNITPRHLLNIKRLAYEVTPVVSRWDRPGASPVSSGRPPAPRLPEAPGRPAVSAGISAEVLSRRIDEFLSARGFTQGQTLVSDPRVTRVTPVSDSRVRPSSAAQPETPLDFVCEEDVRLAIQAGRKLVVSERAIVTPAARDLAEQHRVFSVAPWRG